MTAALSRGFCFDDTPPAQKMLALRGGSASSGGESLSLSATRVAGLGFTVRHAPGRRFLSAAPVEAARDPSHHYSGCLPVFHAAGSPIQLHAATPGSFPLAH